jgi:hypothetical protein
VHDHQGKRPAGRALTSFVRASTSGGVDAPPYIKSRTTVSYKRPKAPS